MARPRRLGALIFVLCEIRVDLGSVLFEVRSELSSLIRSQPDTVGVSRKMLQLCVVEFHFEFDVVWLFPWGGSVDHGVGGFGKIVGFGFTVDQVEGRVGVD